ncbi:hypothetical protein FXO38_09795 [Capsicum annuum]|nr:hypothetical protein FXO38_09795 [Capsicum annuum]
MKRLKKVISSSSKKSASKSKSKKKVDDSGRPRLSKGLQGHSCGFDVESQRARYALLPWHHGVTKANEETINDDDDPPRPRNSYLHSIDESATITLE